MAGGSHGSYRWWKVMDVNAAPPARIAQVEREPRRQSPCEETKTTRPPLTISSVEPTALDRARVQARPNDWARCLNHQGEVPALRDAHSATRPEWTWSKPIRFGGTAFAPAKRKGQARRTGSARSRVVKAAQKARAHQRPGWHSCRIRCRRPPTQEPGPPARRNARRPA